MNFKFNVEIDLSEYANWLENQDKAEHQLIEQYKEDVSEIMEYLVEQLERFGAEVQIEFNETD